MRVRTAPRASPRLDLASARVLRAVGTSPGAARRRAPAAGVAADQWGRSVRFDLDALEGSPERIGLRPARDPRLSSPRAEQTPSRSRPLSLDPSSGANSVPFETSASRPLERSELRPARDLCLLSPRAKRTPSRSRPPPLE